MLQYLITRSERYTPLEQASIVIESGCRWIEVTKEAVHEAEDKVAAMRELLTELKPLCEENEAFLIVDSEVSLAEDFRIHGVHLYRGDMDPAAAREALGAHAVIGADAKTADEIVALAARDIDYAVLAPFGPNLLVEDYQRIINEVRSQKCRMPIVARGEIAVESIVPLLNAGVNGFALSKTIIDSAKPAETTQKILEICNNH